MHTLDYKTENEFKGHIQTCPPVLNPGINRISSNSNEKSHNLIDTFSRLSKNECGWSQQVYKSDFSYGDNVVAYVFVNEVGPVAYVAFRAKNFDTESLKGRHYVLWDLFTFPKFRRQGLATTLVNHGIDDLGIDVSLFSASMPLKNNSKHIVRNIYGGRIMGCWPDSCAIVDLNSGK